MGEWVHRIVDGKCIKCGDNTRLFRKSGDRLMCGMSQSRWNPNAIYRNLIPKEVCSRCGFVPEDVSQLDVDHIDNNHHNNEISNLQVLCANCHRLKTNHLI